MSEQWTDDEIIGAILAGAIASGRALVAQCYFGDGFGNQIRRTEGPVCAVSAGLLFVGIDRTGFELPIHAFARHYAVSDDMAAGVSAGFEDNEAEECEWDAGADYARGWAIGAAVRSAIEADENEVSP